MTVIHRFSSAFYNAPTKRVAKQRLVAFYKGLFGKSVRVVVTSWYGGKTGDRYGKNYWFNGHVSKCKKTTPSRR